MVKLREPDRIDNTQEDCSHKGLTVIETNHLARYRSRWRIAIQKLGCQRASTTFSSPRK